MCMTCNNTGKPLRKITLFLVIAIGIGIVVYFTFVMTNNPAIVAATIPLIMSFAFCPLMCAAMGMGMWVMNKRKKNAQKENRNPTHNNTKQQQPLEKNIELVSGKPCGNIHHKDPIEKNIYTARRK